VDDNQVEIFVRFQDGRAIVAVFVQGRISEREIYSGHGEALIICAYCRGSRVDPSHGDARSDTSMTSGMGEIAAAR
jgi:hypothetical protein